MLPKRSRIGVRNCEDAAMLSYNMQLVNIDEDWFVKEYPRRVKEKVWGEEHTWGDKQVVELEK